MLDKASPYCQRLDQLPLVAIFKGPLSELIFMSLSKTLQRVKAASKDPPQLRYVRLSVGKCLRQVELGVRIIEVGDSLDNVSDLLVRGI